MDDNASSTEEYEDSGPTELLYFVTYIEDELEIIFTILCVIGIVVSVTCLTLAVVSWTFVPKWRVYRNFVFLNIILCYLVMFLNLSIGDVFGTPICHFLTNSSACWTLLATTLYYNDMAKLLPANVPGNKLKSALFSWGLPTIMFILDVIDKFCPFYYNMKFISHYYLIVFTLLVVNVVLYVNVVILLTRGNSGTLSRHKIPMVTVILCLSCALMYSYTIITVETEYTLLRGFIEISGVLLQCAALGVCFVMPESNRLVWRDLILCKT